MNEDQSKEKNHKVKILTKQELLNTAKERVHLISQEFTDGFNFLGKYPKSVTVFGGTNFTEEDFYYTKAVSVTRKIVDELNYAVFTGGGPGIMEAANRGAYEAGGESLGLTIDLHKKQEQNQYLTDSLDFYYFFSRKVCMSFSAEAYIFFPGGYGTLDEFFEIITLIQTGKIEKIPIIMFGSDFWNPLADFMKKQLLDRGTISPEDVHLYKITDSEEEVVDIIRTAPVRNGINFTHRELEKHGLIIEKKDIVL